MKVNVLSKFVGYVLFAISCVFSVELFLRFATTGIDKLCWAMLGIAFMGTEFICSVIGLRLYLHKKMGLAALFTCLFCALYVVSLAGSLGFQSTTSTDAETLANADDEKKLLMKDSLGKIDIEIASLRGQAEEYSKKGYYTKAAKPTLDRIDSLMAQRNELFESLMTYEPKSSSADQFWAQLAGFVGSDDSESVKFGVFLLISCLIDICGAAMIVCGFDTFRSFIEREPSEAEYFGYQEEPGRAHETIGNPAQESYRPFRDTWETRNAAPYDDDEPEIDDIEPEYRSEPATAQEKRPIGFSAPSVQYGTGTVQTGADDVRAYLNRAFETRRPGGHFESRRTIAEKIGITQKRADEIHRALKDKGLVQVADRKTMPTGDLPELLAAIDRKS